MEVWALIRIHYKPMPWLCTSNKVCAGENRQAILGVLEAGIGFCPECLYLFPDLSKRGYLHDDRYKKFISMRVGESDIELVCRFIMAATKDRVVCVKGGQYGAA